MSLPSRAPPSTYEPKRNAAAIGIFRSSAAKAWCENGQSDVGANGGSGLNGRTKKERRCDWHLSFECRQSLVGYLVYFRSASNHRKNSSVCSKCSSAVVRLFISSIVPSSSG